MAETSNGRRSNPNGALVRVLVSIVVALPLAYLAWLAAFAAVLAPIDPALVLRFDETNAQATTSQVARRLVKDNAISPPSKQDAQRVRMALADRPLSSSSLRLLALAVDTEGAVPEAVALLKLAHKISRRDEMTEMLLSNDAVRKADVKAALAHFDAALSTSTKTAPMLFPVLNNALAMPGIRTELARYMDREWASSFLAYAVNKADPAYVASLARRDARIQTDPQLAEFRAQLIAQLAAKGRLAEAYDYARLVSGVKVGLEVFGLNETTTNPDYVPVTWRVANELNLVADLEGKGVFATIDPGSRGAVLYREMLVSPGNYAVRTRYRSTAIRSQFEARWLVDCIRGQQRTRLAEGGLPTVESDNTVELRLNVPARCSALAFTLQAVNYDDQAAADFEVLGLDMVRRGSEGS